MRCGRCGNENADANRFCGMCGAALLAKTQGSEPSAGQAPVRQGGNPTAPWPATGSVSAPQSFPVPPVPRQAPPAASPAGVPVERRPVLSSFDVAREDEPERGPIITGPSFLGLNKPATGSSGFHGEGHGGRAHDHLRSSGNVDYLLEDEEEPKRIWGKVILFLVALILACGFGYLRWKQGGFDWLTAATRKPAAAQTAPNSGQNGADGGGGAATAAAPEGPGAGAGTATAGPSGTTAPAESAAPASQTSAAQATPAQSASPATSSASAPPATAQDNSGQNSAPAAAQNSSSQSKGSDADAATSAPSATGGADSNTQSSEEEQPAAAKVTPRKAVAAKPAAAKPSAAKPVDTAVEAERYIYGSGVRQDCDRGLRMLKTAAGQSDAKAMISLGALYSTGTCAPRDLPTAYRWFALALHKQPDNQSLQEDLQKVWGQMTQPERQLAIKLSQ